MDDREATEILGLDANRFPSWTQGLLITDPKRPDNPIIYANSGFAVLTGYPVAEVLGRNCRFLQGPGTSASAIAATRHAIMNQERYEGDLLNYRKDGSSFWNHLSIAPIMSRDHGLLFVGLQYDVSFRHRSENTPG